MRPAVWFYLDRLEAGGVERAVLNLLAGLPAEGFTPLLLLNEAEGTLLPEVPPGLEVRGLGERRLVPAARALARALAKEPPALLVTSRMVQSAGAALARRLAGASTRLVFAEHTLLTAWMADARMPRRPIDRLLYLLAPWYYREADAVVGVSHAAVTELAEHLRPAPGVLRLCYNPAIPPDLASRLAAPVTPPWPADDRSLILGVGRLSPEKGFDLLISSLAQLHLPVRLALLGTGPERAALEARARCLGVEVHFLGHQPNVFPWLRLARAFALTSSLENFPLALLEALAAGTPAVAFACPHGPAEILTPEVNGLLVPPGDPAAMAAALTRVLTDPELAARLATAGPVRAAAFTHPPCTQAYGALFRELLAAPRTRSLAACTSP